MNLYNFRKIWNPDWYQGNRRLRGYFEGWYFKLVNAEKSAVYAVIPGVSMGEDPEGAYSFIQVINGTTGETGFVKYGYEQFSFSRESLDIKIDTNSFSNSGISLDLPESGFGLKGDITFKNQIPYPVRLFSPGVMGWYRFVPTMECYHGIVSMNHSLHGSIRNSDNTIDFSGGKGYIEKDWGKSMPLSWIWMQSNHFKRPDVSVSFSIANIPWKKRSFTGFLIILSLGSKFYRFTTYTGSKINHLSVEDQEVEIEVSNQNNRLFIHAEGAKKGILKAPVNGELTRTIQESIGSRIGIKLMDRVGKTIIEDSGDPAGLEIAGDVNLLLPKQ